MRLKEWIADSGVAQGLDDRLPRVEIEGDRRLVLENHRGVTEYGETLVRIDCGGSEVRVTGAGLRLAALSLTEAVIEGRIETVELHDPGAKTGGPDAC